MSPETQSFSEESVENFFDFSFDEITHIPLKRTFDIIFSFCALLFLSPFFLLIALGIFFSSKGKVIYSHKRIGRGGKQFYCYKFCTMYPDAETRLQEILKKDPLLKKEWEQNYKLKNDPRVTPFGKILRKTSLDELPQFWNVLKGDLSVVGPRPVVESELINHFKDKAKLILSIRPGLTGIWQVSGRSDINYSTRIHLDETYVKYIAQSKHPLRLDLLFFDIKLIAKTIPSMIFSKGAY